MNKTERDNKFDGATSYDIKKYKLIIQQREIGTNEC